ncbi:MAG: hypothetical protein LPK38_04420 [Actinomycetes bacterium]|nr:hypothetical protein [Actinomycetes bacterium]MDX5399415.1 hypothetical protein [Actinomycetes bacterium]MDX5450273.1 hypothetical protein [Actinomycetes bacterium]
MARRHPPELRAAALRHLAGNGCDYRATAETMDLSPVTLRSWVQRYGLPDKPAPQASQNAAPSATVDAVTPPEHPPAPRLSGSGGPTHPRSGGVTSLVDLTRTEYLRHTVDRLDRIVVGLMQEERPTWSALRPLLALQSDLHREHVEVVRAEGNQLDLSADPTAIARALEAEERLLRVLRVALDEEGGDDG